MARPDDDPGRALRAHRLRRVRRARPLARARGRSVSEEVHPGLEDVVAAQTEISVLDAKHEQIVVRGYDLIELARSSTYADVAYLLLFDHVPSEEERAAFARQLGDHAHLPEGVADILRRLPSDTVAMDALRSGLSILAGFENAEVLT